MSATAEVHHLQPAVRSYVETRFDAEYGVYWAMMNPQGRPCFSRQLLSDLQQYIRSITAQGGILPVQGGERRIRYGVLASKVAGVFNLGGDLAFFRSAITARDREALLTYGEQCIQDLHPWHRNCEIDMTTMALVQGDALGGGFEAALSATVLVAEESARMGFPEILFNLFPGMGAYSFLSRKIGRRQAERLITSGTIYSARELYEQGVVDVITPDGTGEVAVYSYIKKHAKQGNGRRAFESARNEVEPVTIQELRKVVEIWADAALRLEERDLRMMERLVRAQEQRATSSEDAAVENVVAMPTRLMGNGD